MTLVLTPATMIELADIAAAAATRAGDSIMALRETGVAVAQTKTSVNDIVTAADRSAERMIVEELTAIRPGDGIFGEEGTTRATQTGLTWVIDPIDGTVNYFYDLPAYCVSIAACVDDPGVYADGRRALAGAVYNPRTGELFRATAGMGAMLNGTPIQPMNRVPLDRALVATGFGYTPERRAEQAEVLTRVLPAVRDVRRLGSAAYDLCLLASGRVDAYYERGLQPWDYAAGALIATEAGAVTLGRVPGEAPGEPFLIAAAPELATELQLLIGPDTPALANA